MPVISLERMSQLELDCSPGARELLSEPHGYRNMLAAPCKTAIINAASNHKKFTLKGLQQLVHTSKVLWARQYLQHYNESLEANGDPPVQARRLFSRNESDKGWHAPLGAKNPQEKQALCVAFSTVDQLQATINAFDTSFPYGIVCIGNSEETVGMVLIVNDSSMLEEIYHAPNEVTETRRAFLEREEIYWTLTRMARRCFSHQVMNATLLDAAVVPGRVIVLGEKDGCVSLDFVIACKHMQTFEGERPVLCMKSYASHVTYHVEFGSGNNLIRTREFESDHSFDVSRKQLRLCVPEHRLGKRALSALSE